MKYVFPEYKENVVLGNGKLQLNPMSYQVIYGFKAKLGNAKDKYLSFCMGYSLS